MAKKRRSPKIKKLAFKQARGRTKLADAPRPGRGKSAADQPPPRKQVKVRKGQVSLKARATVFAQQQRKFRIRSIVGRAGRGRLDVPGELKQYKKFRPGQIIERRAVNSSWLTEILLVMIGDQPALGCTFKDGTSIVYTKTNLRDWELMAAAGSKGKFIWRRLYHGVPGAGSPYKVI
jgi:hypothetical protein